MSTVKVKAATKGRNKFSPEVQAIIQTLNDKNIRLSMIEYSNLVHKLSSKHRIKPTVLEKVTDFSLPHIYNLICLGGMTSKMKSMVVSGKIKGTDALKLLRKAKNERDFLIQANKLSTAKTDLRKREVRTVEVATKPQTESKPTLNEGSNRKAKVKQLLLEIMGADKLSKAKHHTIDSLVEQLMKVA